MSRLRVPEQDQLFGQHLDRVVYLHQLLPTDGGGEVVQLPRDRVLQVREGGVEVGGTCPVSGHVMVGGIGRGEVESEVVQGQCGSEGNVLQDKETEEKV